MASIQGSWGELRNRYVTIMGGPYSSATSCVAVYPGQVVSRDQIYRAQLQSDILEAVFGRAKVVAPNTPNRDWLEGRVNEMRQKGKLRG